MYTQGRIKLASPFSPAAVEMQPQVALEHLVVVRQAPLSLPRPLQLLPQTVGLGRGCLCLPAPLGQVADRAHQDLLRVRQALDALLPGVDLLQCSLPSLGVEGAESPGAAVG